MKQPTSNRSTKCSICNHKFLPPSRLNEHVHERSPFPDLCLGCFAAQTALEMFYVRATISKSNPEGRLIMGPWARGWLCEILKDPRRYL